jgi:hypothetical protein
MNRLQRAILVAGALAVVAVIYWTPRVVFLNGTMYRDIPSNHRYASVIDVRTLGPILVGVVVVAFFLFVATSTNRRVRNRIEVLENRVEKLAGDVAELETHITEPDLPQRKPSA